MRLFGTLFLACATAAVAGAQHPDAGAKAAPARPAARAEELPSLDAWARWIARDAEISFPERAGEMARATLASSTASKESRATALVALGCVGAVGERPILERMARADGGLERRAAVLALGEMGAGSEALFTDLLALAPDPVAECALLALLRGGRAAGRRMVEELALDRTSPLSRPAEALLAFELDRQASQPARASSLLLRLRWEAAKSYGLVRGQGYAVLVVSELVLTEGLARDVVLRSASRITRPGVKDHVLGELIGGRGLARLRAAVAVMPRELSQLVDSGLWAPFDDLEWSVLLEEIADRRVERLSIELLHAALERPYERYRALAMLAWAGEADLEALFEVDPSQLSVEERLELCTAIGSQPDAGWIERFRVLESDKNARVRAAYVVASMRRGSKRAKTAVDEALADPKSDAHGPIVEALCRTVRDQEIGGLLEDELVDAKGDSRLRIALALTLDGRLMGRAHVRESLAADPLPDRTRLVRLVRALRRDASGEDIETFRALFPREDDRELNVELVLGLLELNDPIVAPILRYSMWRGEFDESILAAGLLAEQGGTRVVRHELRNPPSDAPSTALRRVGFAIGEWGGLPEVEELSRDLRYSTGHPALQGALLGLLAARTHG